MWIMFTPHTERERERYSVNICRISLVSESPILSKNHYVDLDPTN